MVNLPKNDREFVLKKINNEVKAKTDSSKIAPTLDYHRKIRDIQNKHGKHMRQWGFIFSTDKTNMSDEEKLLLYGDPKFHSDNFPFQGRPLANGEFHEPTKGRIIMLKGSKTQEMVDSEYKSFILAPPCNLNIRRV